MESIFWFLNFNFLMTYFREKSCLSKVKTTYEHLAIYKVLLIRWTKVQHINQFMIARRHVLVKELSELILTFHSFYIWHLFSLHHLLYSSYFHFLTFFKGTEAWNVVWSFNVYQCWHYHVYIISCQSLQNIFPSWILHNLNVKCCEMDISIASWWWWVK